MKSQTIKEIVRIFLAFLVSLGLIQIVKLSSALNILMFFLVYILVSLFIEFIIKLYKKRRKKYE